MTPEEFRAPFSALNSEQRVAALNYLLGSISFLATAEIQITGEMLKESANAAVVFARKEYAEVKAT